MDDTITTALPRSMGTNPKRRIKQPWPSDREFRILAVDGGGIRGVFPAAFLAALESSLCAGQPVGDFFELITGTSTGGLIALGLGAGRSAGELQQLYIDRGPEIFPPYPDTALGRARRTLYNYTVGLARYRCDHLALQAILREFLGQATFGSSRYRLVIPSTDGRFGELALFKNRFHPDYRMDHQKLMFDIGLATSAAPTFYPAHDAHGLRYVDGGVWANNPIMLGVIEALVSFDVQPSQIRVLSIGCGDEPFRVSDRMAGRKMIGGGLWSWKLVIGAALRCQSLAALNQARLLLGPANITRIEPAIVGKPIALDDYCRAANELLPAVGPALSQHGETILNSFLSAEADRFVPESQAE